MTVGFVEVYLNTFCPVFHARFETHGGGLESRGGSVEHAIWLGTVLFLELATFAAGSVFFFARKRLTLSGRAILTFIPLIAGSWSTFYTSVSIFPCCPVEYLSINMTSMIVGCCEVY